MHDIIDKDIALSIVLAITSLFAGTIIGMIAVLEGSKKHASDV